MEEEKIAVYCPSCHAILKTSPTYTGEIGCPKCKSEFDVKFATPVPIIKEKIATSFSRVRPKNDIRLGLGILVVYWSIVFFINAINVVSFQVNIWDHVNGDDDEDDDDSEFFENSEIHPFCDVYDDDFDPEECQLLILKDGRNQAVSDLIVPGGIHLYAFYLISRGANVLLERMT